MGVVGVVFREGEGKQFETRGGLAEGTAAENSGDVAGEARTLIAGGRHDEGTWDMRGIDCAG